MAVKEVCIVGGTHGNERHGVHMVRAACISVCHEGKSPGCLGAPYLPSPQHLPCSRMQTEVWVR
eukprot:761941-Hanusia_phi.AAC.4